MVFITKLKDKEIQEMLATIHLRIFYPYLISGKP
jgi:hypothetical protein